jgi:hypothetical protein
MKGPNPSTRASVLVGLSGGLIACRISSAAIRLKLRSLSPATGMFDESVRFATRLGRVTQNVPPRTLYPASY